MWYAIFIIFSYVIACTASLDTKSLYLKKLCVEITICLFIKFLELESTILS